MAQDRQPTPVIAQPDPSTEDTQSPMGSNNTLATDSDSNTGNSSPSNSLTNGDNSIIRDFLQNSDFILDSLYMKYSDQGGARSFMNYHVK